MSLAKKLAELHSTYGVYSSYSLNSESGNILTALNHPEFAYLSNFYNQYIDCYAETTAEQINDDKRVRSKDLFFIGE